MESTGIVRKIDDLGRIVLPKCEVGVPRVGRKCLRDIERALASRGLRLPTKEEARAARPVVNDDSDIACLGLKKSVELTLRRNNIHTVIQLTQCTQAQLLQHRTLGRRTLGHIIATLAAHGLSLTK